MNFLLFGEQLFVTFQKWKLEGGEIAKYPHIINNSFTQIFLQSFITHQMNEIKHFNNDYFVCGIQPTKRRYSDQVVLYHP